MNRGAWTVTRFEVGNYLKKKSWIRTTIIVMVLIALLMSVPSIILLIKGDKDGDSKPIIIVTSKMAVVDHAGVLCDLSLFEQAYKDKAWSLEDGAELENLRARARKGDLYGILEIFPEKRVRLALSKESMTDSFTETLPHVVEQAINLNLLIKSGMSQPSIAQVMQPVSLELASLSATSDSKTIYHAYVQTYIVTFLLYMMIMLYGQFVAQSVAKEKGNRAMEILITSTKPLNLIVGKVIGTTLVALIQIALFFGTFALFFKINSAALQSIEFLYIALQMPFDTALLAILFFILGFVSFAFVFGALGSLVSRAEDVSTTIGALSFFFVIIFMASIFAMMNPSEFWVKVLSFLPLFSPMLLYVRISMTSVMWWEVLLGIGSQLITMVILAWISSKIYRLGVLMYGKPPKFREIIAMLKRDREQKNAVRAS